MERKEKKSLSNKKRDKPGRPTEYTKERAKEICLLIATNTCGLQELCRKHKHLPNYTTVCEWRFKHDEFNDLYLKAKEMQTNLAIEAINEDMDENLLYYIDDKGNRRIDSPSATIAIAKANNKKWYASKIAPKLYGDKKSNDEEKKDSSIIEMILNGDIEVKKK